MNNLTKYETDREKKFELLKLNFNNSKELQSIGQIIEQITEGEILSDEYESYVKKMENTLEKVDNECLNKNWKNLSYQEIKSLMDKFTNKKNKSQDTNNKEVVENPIKNKKSKFNNNAHQNPYIPAKIESLKKSKDPNYALKVEKELINPAENEKEEISAAEIAEEEEFNEDKELCDSELEREESELENIENAEKELEMPENFKSLPIQERYSFLSKKYGNNKNILEKRFDLIYRHYRKEMYIPYESFQINNELLMDLRIFLKYFKDFEITKKFKTNEALKHFKKIAQNGLWLDEKNFVSIHYKLIELLDVNLLLENFDTSDSNKINEMKRETIKSVKALQENLLKLKKLTELISEDKIKTVFKKCKTETIVKKIIESHSGLTQEDVLLKLKERVEVRRKKKSQIPQIKKINTESPDKNKYTENRDNATQRSELIHELSIYKQIEHPIFRSREMRNSSVYSSLEMLSIEKEKERLKEMIKEKDNEKYLQEYFRKERKGRILGRSNSVALVRSETIDSTNSSFKKLSTSSTNLPQISLLKKNFSLPRMKFT